MAIIGSGPYGLSVAAHLRAQRTPAVILGRPMSFWSGMPRGMFLKSPWSASSLSDPRGRHSIDRYADEVRQRTEPIPLPYFLDYAEWFRRTAVGDVDNRMVSHVERAPEGFRLTLDDQTRITVRKLVLATGISAFPVAPDFVRALPSGAWSHSGELHDPGQFRDRRVLIVGRGPSALEWACLLREAGADVELIARGPVRWVGRRFAEMPVVRRLLYPPSDVGPPGINWVVSSVGVYRHLPEPRRLTWELRSIRPAGPNWLRERFAPVRVTAGAEIEGATTAGSRVILHLSEGRRREADHLMLATGYRPDLRRLPILDPGLLREIRCSGGQPVLDARLETSVPGLHVVGALASRSYGPLMRFVAGTGSSARRVARALRPA